MDWDDSLLKERIKAFFKAEYDDAPRLRSFDKDVAYWADSSIQSARNWREGNNVPDTASFLNLCDNMPGFERAVRGVNGDRHQQRAAELEAVLDRIHELSDRSNVVSIERKGSVS